MSDSNEINSYSNIKRISDEELDELWQKYLADKSNKELRDKIIVQYIYLTRYVIGRIKINLPPSFSLEDIASYGCRMPGTADPSDRPLCQPGRHGH